MLKKRSQSAAEFIIIFAVAMAVLIAILRIFFQANDSFSGQLEARKARIAVDAVAGAAETVYHQGAGSRTKVYVAMPSNINYINLTYGLVLINLNSGGKPRDVYRSLGFNVSGSIPVDQGNLWLYFESNEGYVLVSANAAD